MSNEGVELRGLKLSDLIIDTNLKHRLGQGSFAEVFPARHVLRPRLRLAVKIVGSPGQVGRFEGGRHRKSSSRNSGPFRPETPSHHPIALDSES